MLKRLQLNTDNRQKIKGRLVIVVAIFATLHLINSFLPVFQTWNSRLYDLLFLIRSEFSWSRPAYENTVIHVDLDNTSINYFKDYYLNRSYHAKVIANLNEMGVAAQLHDFILVAPSNKIDDNSLIDTVKDAGNSYFGLAFKLVDNIQKNETSEDSDVLEYLENTSWPLESSGKSNKLFHGDNPLTTFLPLATASPGLGFLNLMPDHDGIFRRAPLLIRYGQGYYPSLAFRVICDYLQVTPADITLQLGSSITLKNISPPGESTRHDLVIPVDEHGNLRINFIGPWERMKHYHFSDIWKASEDQDEMELWREELSGKIVVVSQVTTGASDVGIVPTDGAYPLGGVYATIIHTILTESFIHELDEAILVIAELVLLIIIVVLSLRQSALLFSMSTLSVTLLFLVIAAAIFLKAQIVANIVVPTLLAVLSLFGLQIYRAIEDARELQKSEIKTKIFEKELEIGREIQSSFFPEKMPETPGWQIEAFFRPARQVAGDFYDAFPLLEGKSTGIVIADVCDKGVGAALFMALTRSLIRASATEYLLLKKHLGNSQSGSIDQDLHRTIMLTNNYIAEIHNSSNMFATLFFAVLDHETGWLHYINCGHDPPLIFKHQGLHTELRPTGPALGLLPDLEFGISKIQLLESDLLFAYTDGITDAQNSEGELFSKDRLLAVASKATDSTTSLINTVMKTIDQHISTAKQFDDITMVAVKRNNP